MSAQEISNNEREQGARGHPQQTLEPAQQAIGGRGVTVAGSLEYLSDKQDSCTSDDTVSEEDEPSLDIQKNRSEESPGHSTSPRNGSGEQSEPIDDGSKDRDKQMPVALGKERG